MAQFAYPASDVTLGAWGVVPTTQPITSVGVAAGGPTTVAIPAHAVGDLIVILALNATAATIPSLPSGWTNLSSGSGTGVAVRLGYRIATSTSDTSGTWTNANNVEVVVLRGTNGAAPANVTSFSISPAGSTSFAFSAITPGGLGERWVVDMLQGYAGSVSTNSTGLTQLATGAFGDPVTGAHSGGSVTMTAGSAANVVTVAFSVTPAVESAGLYAVVDEVAQDDTDYMHVATSASVGEVGLGTVTDPVSATGHIVHFAARSTGSGAAESLTIGLYQGTTLIATALNGAPGRGTTFVAGSYTLTSTEANSISNYADLRLRFTPTFGAGESVDVSWANLQVPDAAGGSTYTKAGHGIEHG